MSLTWEGEPLPARIMPGPLGYLLALLRVVPLALLVFGGLLVLLSLRLIERPLCGLHRPVTPHVTRFVCRNAFRCLGLRFGIKGRPMRERGAVVANHSSWLDIFALNTGDRLYFVSKVEVRSWLGIGWLARATGTLFIERDRTKARAHADLMQQRLLIGHKILFFPEGTSTDGQRVLPFRTSLFAAFYEEDLRDTIQVQPVSVVYHAPSSKDRRHYGWWGEMSFGGHLIQVLSTWPQGRVEVAYHTPIAVANCAGRKALAAACEAAVRAGHTNQLLDG